MELSSSTSCVEEASLPPPPPRAGMLFHDKIASPALILGSTHNSLNFTNTYLADEIKGHYLSQLEIGDIIKKPFGQLPLHVLHKKPTHQLALLSPRPMGSTPLPTSAKSIAVSGCNGRQQVTTAEYVARIQVDQPEGVILMSDEVAWHMSSKRLRTAVERTLGWFTEFHTLLQKSTETTGTGTGTSPDSAAHVPPVHIPLLFAVVVGGHLSGEEHIERQIQAYLAGGVTGLVIGGIGQGETREERRRVIELVRRVAGAQVPLLVQGVDTLPEIFSALSYGVDMISSNYPSVLSSTGLVLNHHFILEGVGGVEGVTKDSTETETKTGMEESESSGPVMKRQKLESGSGRGSESLKEVPLLNLWDTKYRKDVKAILPGCSCHCCRLYSRAYLHHLLLSHELLAETMLFVHNRHVTLQLFEAARSHIRQGDFADWVKDFLVQNDGAI